MKILWIINTILPFPSRKIGIKENVFGGWMNSLLDSLKKQKNIKKIAIATTYNGSDLKKFEDGKIIYYLLPCKNNQKYNKRLESFWKLINDEFDPTIVHIHGTEYPHGLAYLNIEHSAKIFISIQGLVSIYGLKHIYNAGLSVHEMLSNITLRDILKRDLLIFQYNNFLKRGKYEKEMLQKCDFIIGRTSWDKAYALELSGKDKYLTCNETLRSTFYTKRWNINNIKRHTIFVSQANYPIKGFHNLIKAANILKKEYPDLNIYVAGNNIIKTTTFKEKLKLSGYGLYLKRMIKKYDLEQNITFLGLLKEDEICSKLLESNVYVQASSIENSSNSLGEAMLLGMPCVASYVGGTADLLKDKEEGLLYPFNDYAMLSKYISDIYKSDEMAIKFGEKAHNRAKKTHDSETNVNKIIEIYNMR